MASLAVDPRVDGAPLAQIDACQLCGSTRRTTRFEDPPFAVVACDACSLVYVTPRLVGDALHEVYGEGYWKSHSPKQRGYADYAKDEALYLKTFRRRLAFVRKHLPAAVREGGARVLDVGCAAGFFLRVMRAAGHDVRGVELSAAIAQHARAALGEDRVHVGFLDDVAGRPGFERGSFDLVTMWDVVEHVPDPQALLRTVATMLRPGGTLILETQNVASRFAKLLGPRWQHYKHLEHLYHFDPQTVRELLRQGGFDVVTLTPRYGGKYVSFEFIVERAARLHPVVSVLLSPLRLLRRANLYLNFRDEMVVAARKRAHDG